jgi:hypothetical protein
MEVRIAEYPPTARADTAFDQIHAPAAAVTIGADLRAAEYLEFRHRDSGSMHGDDTRNVADRVAREKRAVH